MLEAKQDPVNSLILCYFLFLGPRQTPYKVLVLNTKIQDNAKYNFEVDENWYRMLSFSAMYDSIGKKYYF